MVKIKRKAMTESELRQYIKILEEEAEHNTKVIDEVSRLRNKVEEENERLVRERNDAIAEGNGYVQEIEKLKEENKKLKEEEGETFKVDFEKLRVRNGCICEDYIREQVKAVLEEGDEPNNCKGSCGNCYIIDEDKTNWKNINCDNRELYYCDWIHKWTMKRND